MREGGACAGAAHYFVRLGIWLMPKLQVFAARSRCTCNYTKILIILFIIQTSRQRMRPRKHRRRTLSHESIVWKFILYNIGLFLAGIKNTAKKSTMYKIKARLGPNYLLLFEDEITSGSCSVDGVLNIAGRMYFDNFESNSGSWRPNLGDDIRSLASFCLAAVAMRVSFACSASCSALP